MKNTRWVDISRRIYAGLLNLYPHEHRAEYGADMLQVFTDLCRQARNGLNLLVLWVRTMGDLVINVVREHITAPGASIGLLEAAPNAPLPWKGVALVLLPGLVFFVSQVAQLTGEDWFFLMVYRAAYFMILPVLVVWVWKRKFPIWGLIPLGLLYKTLAYLGYRIQYLLGAQWLTTGSSIGKYFRTHDDVLRMVIAGVMLLTIVVLLWLVQRRNNIPTSGWIWLGIYTVMMVFHMTVISWYYITNQGLDVRSVLLSNGSSEYRAEIFGMLYYDFYTYGGFLVLILLGALLSRRHGRLAMLLPMGYLLPTILYGRVSNEWPISGTPEFGFLLAVGMTALIYRFLVALAGPLWIVRSGSGEQQKRTSSIFLLVLLMIQAGFNVWLLFWLGLGGMSLSVFFTITAEQLIMGVGIALALVLYRKYDPIVEPQPTKLALKPAQHNG